MIKLSVARKFVAILANVSLLFNSFVPFLLAVKPAYAQEATIPEIVVPTLTPEPTIEITPEITPTVETTPTPEINITPEPTITVEPTIEITPTPEITIEPTLTPEPTIEITPEITPTVETTPTPETTITPEPQPEVDQPLAETPTPTETPVFEKICLTDQQIKDTVNEEWIVDDINGISETKGKVQLGVRYIYPQENKVSVTFKCLPKDESLRTSLKIQKVKTVDLNLPDAMGSVGEYAYDITTGMKDGDFSYDVTLPKPTDSTAEISYIEKSISEAKANLSFFDINKINSNIEQSSDTVKAISVDHFTIFIVYTFDNNGDPIVDSTKPDSNHKIKICHATSSETNPYTSITVDDSSILGTGSNDHGNDPDDIVPSFKYGDCPTNDSSYYSLDSSKPCSKLYNFMGFKFNKYADYVNIHTYTGKNWTPENEEILNNGCNPVAVCGNGVTENPEQCDDGNQINNDGCSNFCTINKAILTVKKHVINDNGGNKIASNFTLNIGNTYFAGSENGTVFNLNPGTYSVGETLVTGYSQTENECVNITLSAGQTRTCTITNNDIQPKLTVTKIVNGGTAIVSDFILKVGSTTVISGTQNGFNAGVYTISEIGSTEYTASFSANCNGGSITLNVGDIKTCTITNTRNAGTLIAHKFEDKNLDKIQNSYENSLKDWEMKLYNGSDCLGSSIQKINTNNSGNANFNNLPTGVYSVKEDLNYESGWGNSTDLCQNVTVTKNTTVTLNFGNYKLGKIKGVKFEDKNGNQRRDGEWHYGHWHYTEEGLNNWRIFIDKNGNGKYDPGEKHDHTNNNGEYELKDLTHGTYTICEQMQNDWYNSTPICQTTEIIVDDTDTINFGNLKYGSIAGYKWNDLNGNGIRDQECEENNQNRNFWHDDRCEDHCEYTEPLISDWTFFIDANRNNSLDDKEISITTQNGNYRFENLTFGTYRICEQMQTGWRNTTNSICRDIDIKSGDNQKDINFGNQLVNPTATIYKSNNVLGDLKPGDSVEYKINLNILGNDVTGFNVTDLLSNGFKYRVGSYKVTKNGLPYSIDEPEYHSPGVWNLGDLKAGDKLELTYIADISINQQAGTYFDLAYAKGQAAYGDKGPVIALNNSDQFVGTQVPVVKSNQNSISAGVERTETISGQVLGASTEMPSTGAATIWLAISGLLGIAGFSLLKISKKTMLTILFTLLSFGLLINPVKIQAADLSVKLEIPKSPTNFKEVDLKFVVLDISGGSITAKCFKKGPNDSAFSQFGSDIVLINGGNSASCTLYSAINDNGSYQFYVTANSVASNTVNLDYKNSTPDTPYDYRKEKINNCDYKIHFKTGNDSGKTVKVEVYRADITNFILDDGSKIAGINIGSDQEYDLTNSVPDCNKNYYYVLRAFDDAGNGSGTVGDRVTVNTITTNTSSNTTGSVSGAIPLIGSNNIPKEGEIKEGDDFSSDSRSGSILGTEKTNPKSLITQFRAYINNHKFFSILLAISLLAIINYGVKKVRGKRK